MFWNRNKKKNSQKDKPSAQPAAKPQSKPQSREAIIAQARANAAQARHEIGEDTLERLRLALLEKQRRDAQAKDSPMEKAKAIIREMDERDVSDRLKDLLRDDR